MNVAKPILIPGNSTERRTTRVDAGVVMRRAARLGAAVLFAVAATVAAPAHSAGDPVAGASSFVASCGNCHVATSRLVTRGGGSIEVIEQHLVDLSERGIRLAVAGAHLDDIAAYLATLHNYSGLWWNAPAGSESGWGLNLAHQGDVIFATWFTYDASGKGIWLAMSASKVALGKYTGTFYATKGPTFDSTPFNTAQVAVDEVGSGTLTFTDEGNGSFEYKLGDVVGIKSITRYAFGVVPTCGTANDPFDLDTATNYQDLWWAAPPGSEAGWGVHLTHQGDTIFATWFTYDVDGTPMWLIATAPRTPAQTYEGKIYRTTGSAYSAERFDPNAVVATEVGHASFAFADGNDGTFQYVLNGVSQTKAITRQVFRSPGTVCR
jgi:mono/diheme cytochrome c family protein